jgi:hypothetical protein
VSPVGKVHVETEVPARTQPIGQSLEEVASHLESYLTAARQLGTHLASLSVRSCAKHRVYWAHTLTAPRHDSAHELTLRAIAACNANGGDLAFGNLSTSILQSDNQFGNRNTSRL